MTAIIKQTTQAALCAGLCERHADDHRIAIKFRQSLGDTPSLMALGRAERCGDCMEKKICAAISVLLESINEAIEPFSLYLTMLEAHIELAELPSLKDSDVILYFMGSGASHQVTVAEFRKLANLTIRLMGDT